MLAEGVAVIGHIHLSHVQLIHLNCCALSSLELGRNFHVN